MQNFWKISALNRLVHITVGHPQLLIRLTFISAASLIFFSLFSIFFFHTVNAVNFTSSGSWTVPAGTTSAIFEAWGGGGAGAGSSTSGQGGGGGGGGNYASSTISVTAGTIYTVTVGAGGVSTTTSAGCGGDSKVTDPSSNLIINAPGAVGGRTSSGGVPGCSLVITNSVGTVTHTGGTGSLNSSGSATAGGGGGGAGSTGNGGNASGTTAGTGTANNGGNGGAGGTGNYVGVAGSNYGGGGSGGSKSNGGSKLGGNGAPGLVVITPVVNSVPTSPTIATPFSGATGVSTSPTFTMNTTDGDNDYLDYRIYLYQSDCSTLVAGFTNPITQTSSQTGWSGQDANGGTAYVGSSNINGSTMATYTLQSTLSANTTYCWKADAVDPAGSNTYSSASATHTFTTAAAGPTVDQEMRGGKYFTGGSEQPYYWAQ